MVGKKTETVRSFPTRDGEEVVTCHLPWESAESNAVPFFQNMAGSAWDPTFAVQTTVSLPIEDPSSLFFNSRGRATSGRIHVVAADPASKKAKEGFAMVDIHVQYKGHQAFEEVDVCMLKKQKGEYGIGIHVSRPSFSAQGTRLTFAPDSPWIPKLG